MLPPARLQTARGRGHTATNESLQYGGGYASNLVTVIRESRMHERSMSHRKHFLTRAALIAFAITTIGLTAIKYSTLIKDLSIPGQSDL